jgi:transposase-like protein
MTPQSIARQNNKLDKDAQAIMSDVRSAMVDEDDTDIVAIMQLQPKYQRLVHLFLTGQYTTAKLAELFDVHPQTVLNWLSREDVKVAIIEAQKVTHSVVSNQLQSLANKAMNKMSKLIDSPLDQVALSASKDVLDRAGYKPTTQIKVDKTVRTFEEKIGNLIDATIDSVEYEEVNE